MERDILFQEFPLNVFDLLNSGGSKMDAELSRLLIKAGEKFLKEMGVRKKGMQLVKDIYETVDRLTREWLKENKIACQSGCSVCCSQMVSCTYMEAEVIKQHLMSLPKKQRKAVIKRVNQDAIYLHELFRQTKNLQRKVNRLTGSLSHTDMDVGLNVYSEHNRQLRPCPYLGSEKKCDIYPARPIDCRVAKTKVRCGFHKAEKDIARRPREITLMFDQVAINLIMDEQRRIADNSEVTPLAGWALETEFRSFFKPDLKELSLKTGFKFLPELRTSKIV